MKKACRATRRQPAAQELFARWPNLRESSQRLTSLLTMYWPDPRKKGDSLLVNCLAEGLSAAEKVILADHDDYDFYAPGTAVTVKPETLLIIIPTSYNAAVTILGEKENINRALISLYKKN